MITEDYASFETAKLLKEKGFDTDTEHDMWYVVENFSTGCHWNSCTYKVGDITREYDEKCCIAMPTLQMAMKWLRKMYDLYIMLDFERPNCIEYKIYKYESELAKRDLLHYNYEESYEEACEEGIKYCLKNLI